MLKSSREDLKISGKVAKEKVFEELICNIR
jgi:hypothetical protein